MKKIDKLTEANTLLLKDTNEVDWYFRTIATPRITNWFPELAFSWSSEDTDNFLYFIQWEKKFFLKVFLGKKYKWMTTHPRFELSSRYDNVIDSYLHKYPPYLSPNESLTLFITNDLPKLIDHSRDKNIYIQCFTDEWQSNIWHFRIEPQLSKLIAEAWITINYVVQLQ